MLGNLTDQFGRELLDQPGAATRAAACLEQSEGQLGLLRRAAAGVVFTGMGGSYAACYAPVTVLSQAGLAANMVGSAELLHFRRPALDDRSVVVAVSQSGESAEVVALARELRRRERGPLLVSVTNGTENTLSALADVALDTAAGPELGPSTLTFQSALVTLLCVARLLGGADVAAAIESTRAAAAGLGTVVGVLLADAPALAGRLREWLGPRQTVVLLGRGAGRPAAEMGALLLKEAARLPAEAMEAGQFRHGPLELAGPDAAFVVLAVEPETEALDLALARDLLQTGAAVAVVHPDGRGPRGALRIRTGLTERGLVSGPAVVPIQLLAWALAAERGYNPAELTRAHKVTVHE